MARPTSLFAASLALLLLATSASGKIFLYRAGGGNVFLRRLTDGSCVPRAFVTVRATFPRWPGPVRVFVNGRLHRVEHKAPYAINGDNGWYAYRWAMPTGRARIKFVPRFGRAQAVTVVRCARRLPVRRRRRNRRVWKRKPRVWRPRRWSRKPKVWRPRRRSWKRKPRVWRPRPWKRRVRRRRRHRPRARRPRKLTPNRRWCVSAPFWKVQRPIARGWVMVKNGIAYKPHDNYHGVFKKGNAPIRFKFRVPVRAQYAVTLDMSTRHWTEWNDCWLRFAGGFVLRRNGKTRRAYGWTKAYHNRNGRAIEAKSVDHNGHSFSTVRTLHPGVTYTMWVGGRSTQLKVHRVLLFPCSGRQCEATSGHWKRFVGTCRAKW